MGQLGARLPQPDRQGLCPWWDPGQGPYTSHPPSPPLEGGVITRATQGSACARVDGTPHERHASPLRAWGRWWHPRGERPSSRRRTLAQKDVGSPSGCSQLWAQIPEASLPRVPQKGLREQCWESPGPFPGGAAAAGWPSRRPVQGHLAASLEAACALDGQLGKALLGATKGRSRRVTARASSAPGLRFLGHIILLPVRQFPHLQNGDKTASTLMPTKDQQCW